MLSGAAPAAIQKGCIFMKSKTTTLMVWLTNLGKYNEGELICTELYLPATDEEIQEAFDKIGVKDGTMYEEAFITDSESDIPGVSDLVKEYSGIDYLNELAQQIEDLEEYELDVFSAIIESGESAEYAFKIVRDGNYMCFYDCFTMAAVAEQYAEETGLLDSMPEHLRYYFDFESYGRDMEIEGHFLKTDNGIIEIWY